MRLVMAAALIALAGQAGAAPQCAERSIVVGHLGEKYGEARQMIATSNGGVVEVFANAETGTWSFIVTLPDGKTCLIADGHDFELTPEPVGEPT